MLNSATPIYLEKGTSLHPLNWAKALCSGLQASVEQCESDYKSAREVPLNDAMWFESHESKEMDIFFTHSLAESSLDENGVLKMRIHGNLPRHNVLKLFLRRKGQTAEL